MTKFRESETETLNTNEIQSDYHFYLQLFVENKDLDFELGPSG